MGKALGAISLLLIGLIAFWVFSPALVSFIGIGLNAIPMDQPLIRLAISSMGLIVLASIIWASFRSMTRGKQQRRQ